MSALLNREFLIRNLCFMYRILVASAPLLEFAIQRTKGELHDYYARHYEEEVGHDAMLLADLRALGISDIPYDYTASQLAGAQYYLIAHHHPAILLGYMLVLEGNALPMSKIEEAEGKHGCKLEAVRHHCEHDPDHMSELIAMRAAQSPEIQAAIDWNAAGVRQILTAECERWLNG